MKAFAAGPEQFMKALVEAVRQQYLHDVPLDRVTPRWEYRKCRRWSKDKAGPGWWSDCQKCFHDGKYFCQGPYLYLYWKGNGKLRKKYMGKNPEDFLTRRLEKCYSHFARLGNGLE